MIRRLLNTEELLYFVAGHCTEKVRLTMLSRNERTMDLYVEAGAYARLFSNIGASVVVAMSKILPAKESDKFVNLLGKFDEIKCKADDQLYKDYPDIGSEGMDVFYGVLSKEPQNRLDEKVIYTAKRKAREMFGREEKQ